MTRCTSGSFPANTCPGAALLVTLDRALPADSNPYGPAGKGAGRPRPEGLAAAVALNALLACNRLGWSDVMAPGHRLAKICGLLGSDYPAEHEAAYNHALRRMVMEHKTWSALVHLPPGLKCVQDEQSSSQTVGTTSEAVLVPEEAEPTPPAPEADWNITVVRLKARMAWRSAAERLLLDELERSLETGVPIALSDARRLRDMWWCAELNDPTSEEITA